MDRDNPWIALLKACMDPCFARAIHGHNSCAIRGLRSSRIQSLQVTIYASALPLVVRGCRKVKEKRRKTRKSRPGVLKKGLIKKKDRG